jgi:hypothetical protein
MNEAKVYYRPEIPLEERPFIIAAIKRQAQESKLVNEAVKPLMDAMALPEPTFTPFWFGAFAMCCFEIAAQVPVTWRSCGMLWEAARKEAHHE